MMYLSATFFTYLLSRWESGKVASRVAAKWVAFSTNRWKGNRSAQASMASVGADFRAPVIYKLACLCTHSSLLINPFVLLVSALQDEEQVSSIKHLRYCNGDVKTPHELSGGPLLWFRQSALLRDPLCSLLKCIVDLVLPEKLLVQHNP